MDPPSGFGLGPFHAGGISAQLELGLNLISFGFFVLALRLWKKRKWVMDFSTSRVIVVKPHGKASYTWVPGISTNMALVNVLKLDNLVSYIQKQPTGEKRAKRCTVPTGTNSLFGSILIIQIKNVDREEYTKFSTAHF